MGDRKSKPTYERLYDMNKEKKLKEEAKSSPRAPALPYKKRDNPHHDLYADAKRL